MEFQCRLGTEHGQVIEGVYVADSEARLRRELEDKGLFILAIRQKGGLVLPGLPALPALGRRRRIRSAEFIVFNQELATLLKAGMPLVQSLDILRQKVPNETFKAVLDDVYEKVRSGIAMSEAFEQHGDLFPPSTRRRFWPARRAATWIRCCDGSLRIRASSVACAGRSSRR